MTKPSAADLQAAANRVTSEWRAMAKASAMVTDHDLDADVQRALHGTVLTLNRALIQFICGGEGGNRDPRDIQPRDFLHRDWHPDDDEMDQRLRGRLSVISKTSSHLSWRAATDQRAMLWPIGLITRETSWAMYQFISEVKTAGSPAVPTFEAAQSDVRALLPPRDFRTATYEYAKARPGQKQHQPMI